MMQATLADWLTTMLRCGGSSDWHLVRSLWVLLSHRFFVCVLVTGINLEGVSAIGAGCRRPKRPQAPVIAYIYGGRIYYLHVPDHQSRTPDDPPQPLLLWSTQLSQAWDAGPFKKKIDVVDVIAHDGVLCRWRISHGCFWWIGRGPPGLSTDFLRLPLARVTDMSIERGNLSRGYNLAPIDAIARRHGLIGGLKPIPETRDGHFDIVPSDKHAFHAFFAWRGEVRVWRGVTELYGPDKLPSVEWDNVIKKPGDFEDARPVLRVRTDMREPFFAYQDKTHFYFVTASGKLYACLRRGDRQRTVLLWDDLRSPIDVVLHDSDAGRTFAFTKAKHDKGKDGRDVWFELAPKLKPKAYDRNEIQEVSPKKLDLNPNDPLIALMEYARVLFREKKIKGEK